MAQQIENGAPFDLFLAADVEHVDRLIASGRMDADTRAVYARGRLVVWIPAVEGVGTLSDLAKPGIRYLAIANPEFAPYGRAAMEALERSGTLPAVKEKIVYAQNVRMTRQFAESGNADAAILAASLVRAVSGEVIAVDEALHGAIEQALAVSVDSKRPEETRALARYLLGQNAAAVFEASGYSRP